MTSPSTDPFEVGAHIASVPAEAEDDPFYGCFLLQPPGVIVNCIQQYRPGTSGSTEPKMTQEELHSARVLRNAILGIKRILGKEGVRGMVSRVTWELESRSAITLLPSEFTRD